MLSRKRSNRQKKTKSIDDVGFVEKAPKMSKNDTSNRKIFTKIINTLKLKNSTSLVSFASIEKGIKGNAYRDIFDFGNAVRRFFSDSFTQNISNCNVYNETMNLSSYFESVFKEYENPIIKKKMKNMMELKKKVNKLNKDLREITQIQTMTVKCHSNRNDKKVSKKEKLELLNKISHLNNDQIKGIMSVIPEVAQMHNNSIEFNFEKITYNKFVTLEKYVDNCLKERTLSPSLYEAKKKENEVVYTHTSNTTLASSEKDIRKNSIILDSHSVLSEDSEDDDSGNMLFI